MPRQARHDTLRNEGSGIPKRSTFAEATADAQAIPPYRKRWSGVLVEPAAGVAGEGGVRGQF
jgi:hypothetical protein